MQRVMPAILRLGLAAAAVYALVRTCRSLDASRVEAEVRSMGWSRSGLGLLATAASFASMAVVEIIATRSLTDGAHRVSRRVAAVTSFVANAFSQSIGLAVMTGAAVRARGYARAGLDALAIGQITAFVTITSTVGLLLTSGIALLAAPSHLVAGEFTLTTKPIGAALLTVVIAYVAWSALGRSDAVGIGRWSLKRPSARVAISQVGLAITDWGFAALVFTAFVPASTGLGVAQILAAFAIAQVVAVTSHVPAGAGVFEVCVLAILEQSAPQSRAAIVAALLLFRLAYYVVPLLIASAIAAVSELRRHAYQPSLIEPVRRAA